MLSVPYSSLVSSLPVAWSSARGVHPSTGLSTLPMGPLWIPPHLRIPVAPSPLLLPVVFPSARFSSPCMVWILLFIRPALFRTAFDTLFLLLPSSFPPSFPKVHTTGKWSEASDQIPSPTIMVVFERKLVTTRSGVLAPLLPRGLYVGPPGALKLYISPRLLD